MNHHHARKLLTERETAEYLAVPQKTLQAWRWRGGGPPFVRIGSGRGHIRYRTTDLESYIEERRRSSTSDAGAA